MAKLEGVKTLDMVNGEITKIEYNGEVYEKVETPKKGDIGLFREDTWISSNNGHPVFTEIIDVDGDGDPQVSSELGSEWFSEYLTYFRKPSAPSIKAGDKIRMLEDDYLDGYSSGDIFTVVADCDGDLFFVDNDGDVRGLGLQYEIIKESQQSEEPPKISVGDFVVAKPSANYTLTVPEAGALEVVEVGYPLHDGISDLCVKFHREFTGAYDSTAYVGEEYLVDSEHFRLATKDEIAETLGIDSVEVGDKVEVLTDDHFYYDKGDTFVVASKDEEGVSDEMNAYILAFDYETDKPRFKVVEKASDKATIKPGDLVRVVDSPGALPEGSVFKVTDVDGYGDIYGPAEGSSLAAQYVYAPRHVELVAKAADVYV